MEEFVGKITVGDWELVPRVEGTWVRTSGRHGRWRGTLKVTEAVARAMARPATMYLLETSCGHRLRITMTEWRPSDGRATLDFIGERYPPCRVGMAELADGPELAR